MEDIDEENLLLLPTSLNYGSRDTYVKHISRAVKLPVLLIYPAVGELKNFRVSGDLCPVLLPYREECGYSFRSAISLLTL